MIHCGRGENFKIFGFIIMDFMKKLKDGTADKEVNLYSWQLKIPKCLVIETLSNWNSVSDTKNKNETENKERECCTFKIQNFKSQKP